jgi:hypothetical protein
MDEFRERIGELEMFLPKWLPKYGILLPEWEYDAGEMRGNSFKTRANTLDYIRNVVTGRTVPRKYYSEETLCDTTESQRLGHPPPIGYANRESK